MFISVDLPEPDCADDGDHLAGLDGQVDAAQGGDRRARRSGTRATTPVRLQQWRRSSAWGPTYLRTGALLAPFCGLGRGLADDHPLAGP